MDWWSSYLYKVYMREDVVGRVVYASEDDLFCFETSSKMVDIWFWSCTRWRYRYLPIPILFKNRKGNGIFLFLSLCLGIILISQLPKYILSSALHACISYIESKVIASMVLNFFWPTIRVPTSGQSPAMYFFLINLQVYFLWIRVFYLLISG